MVKSSKKSPKRRPVPSPESKFYGVHACKALFDQRPGAIIRAYLTAKTKMHFRELMRWCVEHKLAYHIVTDQELEAITGSVHHEGVCILGRQLPRVSEPELIKILGQRTGSPQLILFLDGVGNPHNLGAILRTAANFDCLYLIGTKQALPELSPSACRVAEGAAEHVRMVECSDPKSFFKQIAKLGFEVVATDCHGGTELFEIEFHSQTCFVIGAEVAGVSKNLISAADRRVRIPASGKVESLNVGVATGIVIAEYRRQMASLNSHPST